jgi:hypothetical protein
VSPLSASQRQMAALHHAANKARLLFLFGLRERMARGSTYGYHAVADASVSELSPYRPRGGRDTDRQFRALVPMRSLRKAVRVPPER